MPKARSSYVSASECMCPCGERVCVCGYWITSMRQISVLLYAATNGRCISAFQKTFAPLCAHGRASTQRQMQRLPITETSEKLRRTLASLSQAIWHNGSPAVAWHGRERDCHLEWAGAGW